MTSPKVRKHQMGSGSIERTDHDPTCHDPHPEQYKKEKGKDIKLEHEILWA
jgi:hypothetical protein